MKKLLCQLAVAIMALLTGLAARAQTNLNPSMSTAAIQSAINSAAAGSTVNFAAGTYNITSGLTLKCGVTYTAAVQATPSNVILSASFAEESTDIFTLSGCTSATTISYLSSLHAGLIAVNSPSSNLTITHNKIGDLKCCHSVGFSPAINFSDPASGTTNIVSNDFVTWNQIGDSTSCTTPQNGMTNTDSPETIEGTCAGILISTSVNGLTITNNNFFHVAEGVHALCYGERCSPGDPGGSGPTTFNLVGEFNDFNQIHRIAWEEQPEKISGVVYAYNSEHDWFTPYFGAFGISMACCANPASFSPFLKTLSNLIVFNTLGPSRYGYGVEGFGTGTTGNPAQYTNNMVQTGHPAGTGMAWGLNGNYVPSNFNYNYVCGSGFDGYIQNEFPGHSPPLPTPTMTGVVTGPTCSASVSATPTISPFGGAQSFPLTVTLTDAGYNSTTALANGNTGIWYTTDGSTPVPGSGTAKRLDSGETFILTSAATVKAVGMWGAANQPTSYPSGFGFVPSSVVSAAFTGSGLFLSPTGNDANPGTSASPWLTPNHAMNCGQTITAVSGTYSAANFGAGKWGAVSCPAGNNVVWLTCQTFDTCKIATSTVNQDAMRVDASYWGVQGWETSTSAPNQSGGCFTATARTSTTTVHHIIFANNVANGCQGGGFTSYNNGSAGVDYLTILGNVSYNASRGSTRCFSGISIYTPVASDSLAGTHDYIAGNISYDNLEPNPCAGGTPSDGEGVIVDTMDGSQGGPQYNQQMAVENNIVFNNGGMGVEVINNQLQSTPAKVYFKSNTAVGNATDLNQTGGCLGRSDVSIKLTKNTTVTNNLAQTRAGTSCSGGAIFGSFAETVDASDVASNNLFYSAAGHSTAVDNGGTPPNNFTYTTTTTTNPSLTSVADPGAPSCSGKASAPACVATLIANLSPTASGASVFGYQPPSGTPISDPLYPQWLCGVTLPSGLVTSGCGTAVPAATPVLTPGTESFYISASVSISTTTPGATIHYTTNGTAPTTASPVYSAPVTVTSTTTIQAMAVAPGFTNSAIASGTYTLIIPALTGCNQQNVGSVNTLTVGATAQQFAQCVYAASGTYAGETLTCSPGADKYGNVATAWRVAGPQISIGAIGSASPGLVTGVSATSGTPVNSTLSVGLRGCSAWGWTVNLAPPTPLSVYITGASSLVVPNTTQLAAKCHYSSGADQDCTVTDIYGDGVTSWVSSDPTKATIQNVGQTSPGQVAAVAPGTPSMTVTIGPRTLTSAPFPITVTNPAVTLTGVSLSTTGGVTGLFVGSTNQLRATCTYSDMSSLDCTNTDAHGTKAGTYVSTTPSHATVGSTTGLVTGVAPGTTTFTAHAGAFTSLALPLTVLSVPSGIYTITISGPVRFSGTVNF